MAPKVLSSYAAVVAIDFGTTRSGYRFAFTANPSKIYPNTTWEHAIAEGKTLTEVLLKRIDLSLVAFGYEARNIYIASTNKDEYLYFANFKMTLHNSAGPIRSKVKATNCDFSISTELLISKCLCEIKQRAYNQLNESLSVAISYRQICWVVTVPAIWDIAARQVMLDAASKADMDTVNVVIALEPEGAVLACLENELSERSNLNVHSNDFMVVDAGGGTIDITVHKKTADGSLAELRSPSGGNWGSSYINKKFEQLLESLFGVNHINSIRGSEDWIAVLDSFELAKINYSPKHQFANIAVSGIVPDGFDLSTIAKYNKTHGTKLELTRGILRLASVLLQLFDPSISAIISHIDTLFKSSELRNVKYIFLVGGYAESPMLQERIKEKFGHLVKVIIPPRPSAAVVNGAVRYGLNPSAIGSRVARHSIGVRYLTKWNDEIHQGRQSFTDRGIKWCDDCIWSFVQAGESVEVDKKVEHDFVSLWPTGTTIEVFASPNKNITSTSDAVRIGHLHITFTTPMPHASIYVTMWFGDTTFSVKSTCIHTGQTLKSAFTFNLDELPHCLENGN